MSDEKKDMRDMPFVPYADYVKLGSITFSPRRISAEQLWNYLPSAYKSTLSYADTNAGTIDNYYTKQGLQDIADRINEFFNGAK
jgi:hypothetical protein